MGLDNIVVLENISKQFPGVKALNNVSFALKKGSVHALVGENGAGKSTLMKILSGTYSHYEGRIFFEGSEVHFKSEKDALKMGIAIVPQELNAVPELTIAENLFLGREPSSTIFSVVNRKQMRKQASDYLQYMDLDYDPDTKMKELSVAQIQMIEILKAISRDAKVIIMDEPTSALTPVETQYLFKQIKRLKEQGKTIVFISHKLDEVYEVCDTVTVLRDGEYIGTKSINEVTEDQLIAMMVGREITNIYPKIESAGNEVVMEVKDLTSRGVFENINFEVCKGEILGFAGMMGAGRSEIVRSIFGLDAYQEGEILINGKNVSIHKPIDAIKAGIAMITEDRKEYGFVEMLSIKKNVILPNLDMFASKGILKQKKIDEKVDKICRILNVKAPNWEVEVGNLSGGNQQKVVLSKWLIRDVKVLIMDEPTRGIDVGAKQEIYRLLVDLAREGLAIIFISSEMPEVLAMSHRIMVISDGRIVGTLSREEASQDKIMKLIVEGARKNEANR